MEPLVRGTATRGSERKRGNLSENGNAIRGDACRAGRKGSSSESIRLGGVRNEDLGAPAGSPAPNQSGNRGD